MRNFPYFFYSFLTFVIALFFVLLGVIALLIPWFPSLLLMLQSYISENQMTVTFYGLALVVIGLGVLIRTINNSRVRTYLVHSGKNAIEVDVDLIKSYVDSYWETMVPNGEVPSRLYIRKNRVHIIADLPYSPFNAQKEIMEKIERDLSEIFTKILGYRNDFFLKISFRREA